MLTFNIKPIKNEIEAKQQLARIQPTTDAEEALDIYEILLQGGHDFKTAYIAIWLERIKEIIG